MYIDQLTRYGRAWRNHQLAWRSQERRLARVRPDPASRSAVASNKPHPNPEGASNSNSGSAAAKAKHAEGIEKTRAGNEAVGDRSGGAMRG
jgi:hypothetical protein